MPPEFTYVLLEDAGELAALAERAKAAGLVALDVEFVSEGRYIPELALVQLGFVEDGSVVAQAVDPLQIEIHPILDLLTDPSVRVLAHAARQDLSLLSAHFQVSATGLIDTQIAAAFAGLGEQIGYARLVKETVGVDIDKGPQWTDWTKRPLSDKQIRYAVDDVRYLLPAWDALKETLDKKSRVDWVLEESVALATIAARRKEPKEAYRNVGGGNSLRGDKLAALRALAAWRETEAVSSNKPPSWLLPDAAMVELCRRRAKQEKELKRVRGVGAATVKKYGDAILEAIATGLGEEPPKEPAREHLSPQEQAWAHVLMGLIQARCIDEELPVRFAGTRSDAEALVRHVSRGGNPDGVSLLGGWRRTLIGNDAMAWLKGESPLFGGGDSPGGIRVGG